MRELRRVFVNRIWLGVAAALLVCGLALYVQQQRAQLGCSVSDYAKYNNQWCHTLAQQSWEEGLEALSWEQTAQLGWAVARFYAQLEESGAHSDQEMLAHYRETYPDFDQQLQAVREGTDPQDDGAAYTAATRWLERLTYLSGYGEKVEGVVAQAQLIQSNPFFSTPGTFTYRNADKTRADYQSAAEVKLEPTRDDVLVSLMENRTALVFALCLMGVTVVLLLEPRRLGLEDVERSCARGRTVVALWRAGALALSAVVATVLFQGGVLAAGVALYRQPIALDAPVQSISLLQSWAAPTSVGGFLVWYFAMTAAGLWVAGLLLWLVLSRLRSLPLGLVLCGGVLLVEYHWFDSYQVNDALYPLASLNLFHLLYPASMAGRYLNYNCLGYPVRERVVMAAVLAGLVAVCMALALLGAHFAKGGARHSLLHRVMERLMQRLHQRARPRPLWVYEARKLLLYSGGVLFLAAAAFLLWKLEAPPSQQGMAEALLTEYVQSYQGPLSQNTRAVISQESERVDQAYAQALEAEVDGMTLEYYAARSWALNTLEQRYTQLLEMEQAGAEGLALVDEQPYERIFGDTGEGLRTQGAVVVLLGLCLLVPGCFALESRCGMGLSLWSTPRGRGRLWRSKALLALALTVLLWLAWTGRELSLFAQLGGRWEMVRDISGQSLFFWNEGLGSLPLWVYMAVFYALRLLGLVSACGVVLAVSARLPALLPAAGVSSGVLLLPALLAQLGADLLGVVSWVGWLAGSGLEGTGPKTACGILWLVMGAVALALSQHLWRRYRA